MWKTTWTAPTSELLLTFTLVAVVYLAVILYARITGLRSFSKISASDFAMTVAVGSTLGSAADPDRNLPVVLAGLAALFGLQWAFAFLRRRFSAGRVLDNAPVLLMYDGEILDENLHATQMTEQDLRSKLREANVLDYSRVRAAVFETTGDISVLHSDGEPLDVRLLEGVQGLPPSYEARR